MIFAFGDLSEYVRINIGIITVGAGVAFVYAESIAVRVGGVLLCLAGLLQMSLDRNHRIEAELVIGSVVVAGLAIAILLVFRPRWIKMRNRQAERGSDGAGPKGDPGA